MAVCEVLRMGDARLLQKALPVDAFDTEELHGLIRNMRDTMGEYHGAGLAAPQIGVGLRVVIFGGVASPRYPDAGEVPDTVLINPEIVVLGTEIEHDWEGCLSLPGLRGRVPRYTTVRYSGVDPYGAKIEREVTGFHARVVQHECDHLDGTLYPMRMDDMSRFGFEDVLDL